LDADAPVMSLIYFSAIHARGDLSIDTIPTSGYGVNTKRKAVVCRDRCTVQKPNCSTLR